MLDSTAEDQYKTFLLDVLQLQGLRVCLSLCPYLIIWQTKVKREAPLRYDQA